MTNPASNELAVPPKLAPLGTAAFHRVPDSLGLGRRGRLPSLGLALGFAFLLTACGVLFFLDPSRHGFYPVCMFHRVTGLNCPGCGGLRAMHQLLHGHLAAAFRDNALLVLSLPIAAWWAARWRCGMRNAKCGMADPRPAPRSAFCIPRWLWIFMAAAIVFTVLRNLPVPQLRDWLSP